MLYEDLINLRELKHKSEKPQNTHIRGVYKLGEKLGPAGVIYFGQDQTGEEEGTTAMFICPKCTELFRCRTDHVVNGNTKSCGCKQTPPNKSKD